MHTCVVCADTAVERVVLPDGTENDYCRLHGHEAKWTQRGNAIATYLSSEAFDQLMIDLDAPPKEIPGLADLMRRGHEWE